MSRALRTCKVVDSIICVAAEGGAGKDGGGNSGGWNLLRSFWDSTLKVSVLRSRILVNETCLAEPTARNAGEDLKPAFINFLHFDQRCPVLEEEMLESVEA